MRKKRIATISLAAALAAGFAAAPTAAVPNNPAPGACNMFNVFDSHVGFAGMEHSENGQGLANMVALLAASGCL